MKDKFVKFAGFVKKHKLPIIIGAVILVVILAGVGIYFAINNNEKTELTGVAAEYQERLPELEKEVEDNPESAEARKKYAVALYATGEKDLAEKQYEEVVKINDQDGVAYNNLGNAYRDNKKTDKAIEAYKKAIEINSTAINPYVNLANIQLYTQDSPDAAIETYKQALKAIPNNNDLETLLAIAYEQKGDKESARSTYQNILSRDAENKTAQSGLERLQQ